MKSLKLVACSSSNALASALARSFSAAICSEYTISCMRSFAISEVIVTPFFIKASIIEEIASSLRNSSFPFPFLNAVSAFAPVSDLFHSFISTSNPVETLILIFGTLVCMRAYKVAYPSFLSVLKMNVAGIFLKLKLVLQI